MGIMAVDADKAILRTFEMNLRTVFPEEQVVTFYSPLEALKYADQNTINILFTDVRLKPIDGYELIKAIRKKQKCYAYVVSGSREKPDDLRWMAINGCFTKPISMEDLRIIKAEYECGLQDE